MLGATEDNFGERDPLCISEGGETASKREHNTECKNKADSIETNRSNDLSGEPVNLQTPYKLMQTPPKDPKKDA